MGGDTSGLCDVATENVFHTCNGAIGDSTLAFALDGELDHLRYTEKIRKRIRELIG